jgi:hypothetical protein
MNVLPTHPSPSHPQIGNLKRKRTWLALANRGAAVLPAIGRQRLLHGLYRRAGLFIEQGARIGSAHQRCGRGYYRDIQIGDGAVLGDEVIVVAGVFIGAGGSPAQCHRCRQSRPCDPAMGGGAGSRLTVRPEHTPH